MPEGSDWRNAANYNYLQSLEPAALAWEFLRRNADYRQDYGRTSREADAMGVDALMARWGVRFPHRPESVWHRGGNLLDPFHGSRNAHSGAVTDNTSSCFTEIQR